MPATTAGLSRRRSRIFDVHPATTLGRTNGGLWHPLVGIAVRRDSVPIMAKNGNKRLERLHLSVVAILNPNHWVWGRHTDDLPLFRIVEGEIRAVRMDGAADRAGVGASRSSVTLVPFHDETRTRRFKALKSYRVPAGVVTE